MAVSSIAAAASGGKSAFDRAAILRCAHSEARRLLTWSCFRGTYRQAFRAGLTLSWQAAKAEREEAWAAPITMRGNELHAALLASAHELRDATRDAARAAALTTGGIHAH